MVEERDQVLIMVLSPTLSLPSFLSNFGSTNTPFLILLDMLDFLNEASNSRQFFTLFKLPTSLLSSSNYKLTRLLFLFSGFNSARRLAPRSFWSGQADRLLSFTASVRMVNRIHSRASHGRPDAFMSGPSGLADNN